MKFQSPEAVRAIKYKSNAIGAIQPCVQFASTLVTPCSAAGAVFDPGVLVAQSAHKFTVDNQCANEEPNEAKYRRECVTAAFGDDTRLDCPL